MLGTVECWLIWQFRWVTTFSALEFSVWRRFALTHKLRQSTNITYHGFLETQHTKRVDCDVFHDMVNNVTAVAVSIFEHTVAFLWAKKNALKTQTLKTIFLCARKEWVSPTSHASQRTPPSTVASSPTPSSRSSWWFPKRRPEHHGEGVSKKQGLPAPGLGWIRRVRWIHVSWYWGWCSGRCGSWSRVAPFWWGWLKGEVWQGQRREGLGWLLWYLKACKIRWSCKVRSLKIWVKKFRHVLEGCW